MKLKLFFLFIIILNIQLFSQSDRADFFIAKDLSSFEILDRYQQKVSSAEKQKLPEYAPFKIINRNMVLGDRFTHAMQAEYQGSAYFVVLNEDGTFKNNPDTFNEIFDDCRMIDDNISVLLAKGVLFREIPFSDKSALPREYMDSGTEMQRLFKKGQSYFVKIMPSGKYGWIRISKSSAVTILDNSKPQKTTNIGTDVFVQVEKNVSDINSVYSQLFSYLNKEYSSDKNAPFWKMQSSEDQILLTLNNVTAGQLKKSNAYFLNDLEHIFMGHKVVFETSPDSIKIYLNNED